MWKQVPYVPLSFLLVSCWSMLCAAAQHDARDELDGWQILLRDAKVTEISAVADHVYAATEIGLWQKLPGRSGDFVNDVFDATPVTSVFVRPVNEKCAAGSDATVPTVFAIKDKILYHSTSKAGGKWLNLFANHSLQEEEILGVHGNEDRLVILVKSKKDRGSDAATRATIFSEVYVVDGCHVHPLQLHKVASFGASQVVVDSNRQIYTYVDALDAGGRVNVFRNTDLFDSPNRKNNEVDDWINSQLPSISRHGQLIASSDWIFVTSTDGNLVKSETNGKNWDIVKPDNQGVPASGSTSAAIYKRTVLIGFADDGMYISRNEGESFTLHVREGDEGFPTNKVNFIAVDAVSEMCYVGYDGGLASRPLDAME